MSEQALAPKVSVCMIVKNEEAMLPRALESVRGLADELIVVDTGSTDKTVEIAQAFGARIFHHPWENNFSKHRNQSLAQATGDWIFVIDADEELEADAAPILRRMAAQTKANSISMPMHSVAGGGIQESQHNALRFFRNHVGASYAGSVHNELVIGGETAYAPVRMFHYGYNLSREKMAAKFHRTVGLLREGQQKDPENPRWPHYLAVSFHTENLIPETLEMTERVFALCQTQEAKRQWITSYYLAAACRLELRQFDQAKRLIEEGLAVDPDCIDLWAVWTSVAFLTEAWDDLERACERYLTLIAAFRKDPALVGTTPVHTLHHGPFIHLRLAMAARMRQDETTYAHELDQALLASHDRVEVLLSAAQFLLRKGELSAAHELLLTYADKTSPKESVRLLEELAKLNIDLGRPAKAREVLDLAETRGLERARLLYLRGLCELHGGDLPKALELFEARLNDAPNDMDLRMALALTYERLGRKDEAEAQYLEVVANAPDPIEAAFRLGKLYTQSCRFVDAIAFLEKVTDADDARLDAHLLLARLYWEVDLADKLLQRAWRLGRRLDLPEARKADDAQSLGAVFLRVGEFLTRQNSSACAIAFELACLLRPEDGLAHLAYGQALAHEGLHPLAIKAFERAAHLVGDNPDVFAALARSYDALDVHEAAEVARAHRDELLAAKG